MLQQNSVRFATVVVGGSAKNHGNAAKPGKRRGPKVTGNEIVKPGNILIKQRWWIEKDKQWHGGFNVHRGGKGTLNALIKGKVLYYYDTNEKKKYISVVPLNEDPRDYMRAYFTPSQIYRKSHDRSIKRITLDSKLNVNRKNKELNQIRNTQLNYINKIEHIPMELIIQHESDQRFKDENFSILTKQSDKLNNIKPIFEEEQINYALNRNLEFEYDKEKAMEVNKAKEQQ